MKPHLIEIRFALEQKLLNMDFEGKLVLSNDEAMLYGTAHADILPELEEGDEKNE